MKGGEGVDRFQQGLPDPQSQPAEPIDECANDECQSPIYQGDKVWKFGSDSYCTGKCLAKSIGAAVIEAGED